TEVGQVAARLRLGEALAPVLVGGEDPREPPRLLLLCSPADDHGPDLPYAVGVEDAGGPGSRHLLGVDDVLHDGGFPTAPLPGPVDGCPPSLVQPPLPGLAPRHGGGEVGALLVGFVDLVDPVVLVVAAAEGGEVPVQPRAQLGPEDLVLRREREVHRPNTNAVVRCESPASLTLGAGGVHLQPGAGGAARGGALDAGRRGAHGVRAA